MKYLQGSGCGVVLHHHFMLPRPFFDWAVENIEEEKDMNTISDTIFVAMNVSPFPFPTLDLEK